MKIVWVLCCHLSMNTVIFASEDITVTTLNLWNIMFNWDVRKLRIAQMVKECDPDVIGFEEVRGYADGSRDQITELQAFLPRYKWSVFKPAQKVQMMQGVYKPGWQLEGIGLLSKYPITESQVQNLTYRYGPDTNHRIVLHVKIQMGDTREVNIVLVHLSYDKYQQCGNVLDIFKHITDSNMKNLIILGDFNIYKEYENPAQLLTHSIGMSDDTCRKERRQITLPYTFRDAWVVHNTDKLGLTFSNMPHPGFESRPDRILISPHYDITSTILTGTGREYQDRYYIHILWHRLRAILGASRDSYHGYTGRSCVYDCGPHASCRCGVCVAGGDKNTCDIEHCHECNHAMFTWVVIVMFMLVIFTVQFLIGALRFMQTMNERGRLNRPQFMFGDCCLCNPDLYTGVSTKIRRSRTYRWFKFWPLCRLSPVPLMVVSLMLVFVWYEVCLYMFSGAVHDLYAIIPEELYPSDHLMLTAGLKFNDR